MDPRVSRHVDQINKLNQRGGRMLSIRDLIDANTLDVELASYLLATISKGSSFLVGARPGGAGKTTVMGALLNFIPEVEIVPTENSKVIERGFSDPVRKCFVAHEIGHGPWYAYVWGEDTSRLLELAKIHIVVGNLHADTLDEVLSTPGIDEENLSNIDLLIFLRLFRSQRGVLRRIGQVLENGGKGGARAFRPIFLYDASRDGFRTVGRSVLVDEEFRERAREAIRRIIQLDLRTIEQVRSFIVNEFLADLH